MAMNSGSRMSKDSGRGMGILPMIIHGPRAHATPLRGSREIAWHGHLARDSLRHFVGNRTFFTGKMPVPRLKTSISQPAPLHSTVGPVALHFARPALLKLLLCLSLFLRQSPAWEFAPSQAQNVELCGHVGGSCRAVAVAANCVLIGQGPRLSSVDVSSPTRPVQRASFLLPAKVKNIALSGSLACVLADGLWVVDASDSRSLREVGHLPLSGEKLLTSGTVVFVLGTSPNIQVVDIRYPSSPLRIGLLDLPHSSEDVVEATGLAIKGRYALVSYVRRYYTHGFIMVGGFTLLDISDPKTPGVLGDFRTQSPVYGAALDGNSLYLLQDRRIELYDVTNPLIPQSVGGVVGPNFSHDISIMSGRAYVAGSQSAIWTFALAGAQLPRELVRGTARGEAVAIAATDKHLFVADGWAGFRIFDATKTGALAEVGSLNPVSDASDIAVANHYAFVADGRSGLRVFDLYNRDRPIEVGGFKTSAPALGVRINGSYACVVEDAYGLELLDLHKPASPTRLAAMATSGSMRGVTFLGEYALIADGPGGLLLIRLTDPAHPVSFGRCSAPGYAESVVASVNRAFVCDRSALAGLWEINVSSPGFPTVADRFAVEGEAVDLALSGDRVCMTVADQGLRVLEVVRPGALRTTARVATSGSFQGVAYEGNVAYIADASFGVRVFSLLDPYNPSEAGFITTAGFPRRVAIAYGRIYLAAGDAGLYVLRYHWSPDLTIRDFDCQTQDVVAGSEVYLSGDIFNNSTTPTVAAFSVNVCVSPHRYFADPRILLCPPLRVEAGFSHLNPINLAQQHFVVLGNVPNGIYRLGIIVDADNEVAEFREDNNVAWVDSPFYVGPRPTAAKSWQFYR